MDTNTSGNEVSFIIYDELLNYILNKLVNLLKININLLLYMIRCKLIDYCY